MKKVVKKVALLLIVFGIGVGVTLLYMNNKYKVYEEENPKQIKKHVDTISMMLETEANSGNYEMTTRDSWPTEGYIFNTELSKCENGGELSWDNTTKQVLMSGNVSDKCYVYFDVYVPPTIADFCSSGDTLVTCVKNFGDQGSEISSIYIHNSSLTNGAGDNSYRYAGASESVNNYVCFGSDATPCPTDNLYRIIGVFGNNIKLIKYDYANSNLLGKDGDYNTSTFSKSDYSTYRGELTTVNRYSWNKSTRNNTWSESNLNKVNLNKNYIAYLNNIDIKWAKKIAETTWKVGGNTYTNILKTPSVAYQNEITNAVTTNTTDGTTDYTAKIGLMYVSDYGFAAEPSAWTLTMGSYINTTVTSTNWMYMGLGDWTISRNAEYSGYAFCVSGGGDVCQNLVNLYSGCRPSFNLESSITYVSGDGTQDSPIIIN